MENSPPPPDVEGDLSELVSSINERLTSLETKVTKLSSSQEQGGDTRELSVKLAMFL